MTSPSDRIEFTHPDIPGSRVTRSRRTEPALKAAGWVRFKSPAPADEPEDPRKGHALKEGPK